MGTKILVVEDEPSIADNIIYALSTEGFEPQWVQTAIQAIEVLQAAQHGSAGPSLLILDVGLPDENGFELAKKIKTFCDTPIIFVTARSDEIDRIIGLEIGADDYVVKPFSPRELTARVKAVLRRAGNGDKDKAPEKDPRFVYGPFVLDDEKMRILFDGNELDLSRYEFRLLRILLKSPGRVYTREHLMQIAWEVPDMSLERTVDTHIKTIRRKIKQFTEQEWIITHRGTGYSMQEAR